MATFSYSFSGQSTANPWTPPSSLSKLSATNFQILNGSGLRSATTSDSYGIHNSAYTGGSTEIVSEITFGTPVYNSDFAYATIICRSGANAGKGYGVTSISAGTGRVVLIDASGGTTGLAVNTITALSAGSKLGIGYKQSTNTITVYVNGVSQFTVTDSTYAAETDMAAGFEFAVGNSNSQYITALDTSGVAVSGAATISSPTPSGTIGTSTTATIGCTTNQASGTLYYIASINQVKITGATAAQIKAGQGSDGVVLGRKGSAAISNTTPSINGTGFTAGSLYYYAVLQNNANGDSNVIDTGSFTTAAASSGRVSHTMLMGVG